MSRLEEIEYNFNKKEWFDGYHLNADDIEWLIQQAERYEELLPKWNNYTDRYNNLVDDRNKIVEELHELRKDKQRYKQALEEINKFRDNGLMASFESMKQIARQALAGDNS